MKADGRCNRQQNAVGEDRREKMVTSCEIIPLHCDHFLEDRRIFGVNEVFNFVFNLPEYSTPHLVNDKPLVCTQARTRQNKFITNLPHSISFSALEAR